MKKNISFVEALARILFGTFLVVYLVIGGPWWASFGLYLLLSGSFQFCLLYFYLAGRKA